VKKTISTREGHPSRTRDSGGERSQPSFGVIAGGGEKEGTLGRKKNRRDRFINLLKRKGNGRHLRSTAPWKRRKKDFARGRKGRTRIPSHDNL